MIWLFSGIGLWAVIHFVPSVLPGARAKIIETVGENRYKGVFSILIITALVMIVVGWRTTIPNALYSPPRWGTNVAFLLMFFSVVLFGAGHAKTNIKRVIRHPQLTAMMLWSIAHIVSNGDSRSLVLFGGLGFWAFLEMALIDHREGEWVRPERAAMKSEAIGTAISAVVFLVLVALHPYFAGVSPLPR